MNNQQLRAAKKALEGFGELMEVASTFQLPGLAKKAAQCQLKITQELVEREIERDG